MKSKSISSTNSTGATAENKGGETCLLIQVLHPCNLLPIGRSTYSNGRKKARIFCFVQNITQFPKYLLTSEPEIRTSLPLQKPLRRFRTFARVYLRRANPPTATPRVFKRISRDQIRIFRSRCSFGSFRENSWFNQPSSNSKDPNRLTLILNNVIFHGNQFNYTMSVLQESKHQFKPVALELYS